MKRRDFVASSLAVAASSLWSGCANYPLVRNPAEVCSPDFRPEFDTSGELQIDVHRHVFNASDLRCKDSSARASPPLGVY